MPRINNMFPSKYLSAADLEESDHIVTIRSVDETEIQDRDTGRSELKWLVSFVEFEKGLILNKTNTTTIAKLHGDDTDEWISKKITIFPTQVNFGKDVVDAIRVRDRLPKTNKPKPVAAKVAVAAPAADDVDEMDEAPF